MRLLTLGLLSLGWASGQVPTSSETNVYTFDPNGHRLPWVESVTGDGTSEQRLRNLNGATAPLERVEQRVVREDGSGRVIERIVRPFDPTGQPGPPRKYISEERKGADGSIVMEMQVLHGTINGSFSLHERITSVARQNAEGETVETQVARPTLNGAVEVVERKQTQSTPTGLNGKTEEETTFRKDVNGSFRTAVREVREVRQEGNRTVENAARYYAEADGRMVLSVQAVSETRKEPGGSEITEISIFGLNAPGRPAGNQPQLREVQIIEKKIAGGSIIESLSIRRPALDDARRLGPPQKVSERVCTGSCR